MVSLESIDEYSKYLNYSLIEQVSTQKLHQLTEQCSYIRILPILKYLSSQNDLIWSVP